MNSPENSPALFSDRYELKEPVSDTAIGKTFLAVDHVTSTEVLLTVHQPTTVDEWHLVSERVRSLSRLTNESMAAVLDCQQTAAAWFVTTELVKGTSLRDEFSERCRTEQRYSMDEIRLVADLLSAALVSVHAATYHGEISLETVFRLPDGSLKLGTPAWHRPEITDRKSLASAQRDDQRMLASVIYELLAGKTPGKNSLPVHQIRKSIPVPFSNALQRALDAAPEKRFRSMTSFRKGLLSSEFETSGKYRILSAGMVVIAVALLLSVGWKMWPQSSSATKTDFARLMGEIEGHKQLAERLDAEIASDASSAREELEKWRREIVSARASDKPLQLEYAQQRLVEIESKSELKILIGDVWSRHQNKAAWMTEAAGLLAAAKSHAEDGDLDAAMKEMTETEVLWKRFSDWRQNAQQALEMARQTQADLKRSQAPVSDAADWAFAWPEGLLNGLNGKLEQGDGQQAVIDVRNAASALPTIQQLLERRSEVLEADKAAETLDQIHEARIERQKQTERRSQADERLRAGRFSECESLLNTIHDALQSLPVTAMQTMYNSARQSLSAQKSDAALHMVEQILQISSDNPDAARIKAESLVLRADLLSRDGQFDAALADCDASLVLHLTCAAHVVRASIQNVRGEFDAALSEADAALAIDPDSAEALNQRGFAYYRKGNFSEALRDFDHALRLSPDFADVLTNRGLVYFDQAENEKALADFESALRLQPHDFQALAGRANLRRLGGDFAASIRDCDAALNAQPEFSDALVCRGSARLGLGEIDAAIVDLRRAIELNSNDLAAHVFLATALNQLKEFQLAVDESETALGLDDHCVEALVQRATGFQGLQNLDSAEVDFGAVLVSSPQHLTALSGRGEVRLRKQDPAGAVQDFSEALRLDPECVTALVGRSTANVLLGDFESAIADCTAAVKLNPQNVQCYRTRAVAHAKLGHNEEVIADCSTAIAMDGQFVECLTMRAAAYLEKAEYQKSIDDCSAALRLSPDLAEAWRIRAAARFKVGDKDEATADFNQALRLEEKK